MPGEGYEVTTWKQESGLEGLLYQDATGILLCGLTLHYGTPWAEALRSRCRLCPGTAYGFGGRLTRYRGNGFTPTATLS